MCKMLSFVIPVYKTPEQLLRNCLNSVLRYSQPMELICVLDSPGDPCETVLDEYAAKESRMRLLKNDQNRGVSYSRNRGMDAARGEYIAFVDADDEIVAEGYEKGAALSINLMDRRAWRIVRGANRKEYLSVLQRFCDSAVVNCRYNLTGCTWAILSFCRWKLGFGVESNSEC